MWFHLRLPGARLVRNCALALCLAGLGAVLAFWPWLGGFLSVEDPLLPADAIVVLAGSVADRPLEAWDLYRQGLAPIIVLSRQTRDGGQIELARRGIAPPDLADSARDLLQQLGVPPGALLVPDTLHDSTVEEARTIHALARDRHWRRVIIVTSKFHTRRARLIIARRLRDLGVDVRVRGSRYDTADPAHWWRRRSDIRWTVFEGEKLLFYWMDIFP